VANVIGRVTTDSDRPRGPDARLDVRVPAEWLRSGATVEVELPRNLTCALCEGGGCDACDRSGAVTLRGRGELAEVVEVTLPPRRPGGPATVILRVPDYGGLPAPDTDLPRGNLLLRVSEGPAPDAGVARMRRSLAPNSTPSVPVMSSRHPPEAASPWQLIVLGLLAVGVFYAFWKVLFD
jgi:hypothetical protein